MKVFVSDKKGAMTGADVLILPVMKGGRSAGFNDIDKLSHGILSKALKKKQTISDFRSCEFIHVDKKGLPELILLVGLGEVGKIDAEKVRAVGGAVYNSLRDYRTEKIALSVKAFLRNDIDFLSFVEGFFLSDYSFDKYKSGSGKERTMDLVLLKKETKDDKKTLEYFSVISESVKLARDLVNTPSNEMLPSTMADIAGSLGGGKLKVSVMDGKEIKKLGLNAFYSVAKGSKEEPRLIVMDYSGKRSPTIALIGKSITFDSGGISLKPSKGMEKMKYDMAGGAAVLGVMKAVNRLKLPVHLIGIIPACENLPGGSASKPGDVVKTFGGKTVEIVNTDAEGRLVLADAIGYTKKLGPKVIINIATLTGACSVALGNEAIAMMGNDQDYMERLQRAASVTGEKVWQMPLYDEYGEYIKSEVADIKNTGERSGSLVTAGYFLKEFAGDIPWVHLDIASTAWTDKDRPYVPKGATGIGVRLLTEFIKEIAV